MYHRCLLDTMKTIGWLNCLQISLFESCGNYSKVHFEDKKPLTHKSLNQLERLLQEIFFHVNRQ
jgi:hypothetical protein